MALSLLLFPHRLCYSSLCESLPPFTFSDYSPLHHSFKLSISDSLSFFSLDSIQLSPLLLHTPSLFLSSHLALSLPLILLSPYSSIRSNTRWAQKKSVDTIYTLSSRIPRWIASSSFSACSSLLFLRFFVASSSPLHLSLSFSLCRCAELLPRCSAICASLSTALPCSLTHSVFSIFFLDSFFHPLLSVFPLSVHSPLSPRLTLSISLPSSSASVPPLPLSLFDLL